MVFCKNLSTTDRVIRLIIGMACLVFVVFYRDLLGEIILVWIIGIYGVLNLLSAFISWCPMYQLANINTRNKKTK